jgi:flagellar hook-length control protein FliK
MSAPAAAAAAAPALPQQPQPPATQLAARIAPLRQGPDGVHRIAVELHPADLGTVGIVAEIRNGNVHLHFTGGSELTRETLRQAMPDLRRELQDAGFANTGFDLDENTSGGRNPFGPAGGENGRSGRGGGDGRGGGQGGSAQPDDRTGRSARTSYGPPPRPDGRTGGLDLQV